jgi:hypothetical protein
MAKKAPAKPAAKRKPRAKKPVPSPNTISVAGEFPKSSSPWRRSMLVAGVVAGLAVSFGGGVWSAGGINIGPDASVFNDSLAKSHKNDRASQIRILREYAGKTFENEPEAQKWLNDQRIAARPGDWGPYTDELGIAADAGPDAVKAFADKLEGKQ